ncbi:MAG: tryptophan synthase subunit alpha [Sphingobacterium sp.]|uniref:tryptophan synthase subunit alpha n=1 Tax=Sphingobacterium sp. JB170 TaxID=1434842 RepID=UPI00097F3F05|nr:tryptophan synthase subunit alpha [Sphingobacterium sp. JB170]SJN32560.1 Tryptophan synthase alpha chain [Sphingobacterium sp. JB170]
MQKENIINTGTDKRLLSIYYTAGYPTLDSTLDIAEQLERSGVDFLEIGVPYSDPVADGPVIQRSSQTALENGMTVQTLFDQLQELSTRVTIPVFLMGYFNPVLQFGVENFCKSCREVGVTGVIIPDLPLYEYEELYQETFMKYGISNVFLVTPQTSDERIRKIDNLSNSFIYLLSSNATTGKNLHVNNQAELYFERLKSMKLKSPLVIGFGISDAKTFQKATDYATGAIIGTAFVNILGQQNYQDKIEGFINNIIFPAP